MEEKDLSRSDQPQQGISSPDPRGDDQAGSMLAHVCRYGTHKWHSWERDGANHIRRCRRCPATEAK